jgi:hypothetical protein
MNLFSQVTSKFHSTLSAAPDTLSDVLIAYRRPNVDPKHFLGRLLSQIRVDLTSKDFALKYLAAQKLLFLLNEEISSDCSWAIFPVIELMGSARFEHKRLAYLLAPLLLKGSTADEPLMNLLPNIFRKVLKSMAGEPWTVSIAVTGLSRLCNEDLAGILYKELLPLYACSKSYIRKKVCIVSHKVFINAPECIPELLPYLCDRVKDTKVGVQISAISSIQEITRINPRLFLVTIPSLFEVFNSTKSNWLIIKLIKLVRLSILC